MKANLKVFCVLRICIISVINCGKSEFYSLTKCHSVVCLCCFSICCLGAMKNEDLINEIALNLFQDCDVIKEVHVNYGFK